MITQILFPISKKKMTIYVHHSWLTTHYRYSDIWRTYDRYAYRPIGPYLGMWRGGPWEEYIVKMWAADPLSKKKLMTFFKFFDYSKFRCCYTRPYEHPKESKFLKGEQKKNVTRFNCGSPWTAVYSALSQCLMSPSRYGEIQNKLSGFYRLH